MPNIKKQLRGLKQYSWNSKKRKKRENEKENIPGSPPKTPKRTIHASPQTPSRSQPFSARLFNYSPSDSSSRRSSSPIRGIFDAFTSIFSSPNPADFVPFEEDFVQSVPPVTIEQVDDEDGIPAGWRCNDWHGESWFWADTSGGSDILLDRHIEERSRRSSPSSLQDDFIDETRSTRVRRVHFVEEGHDDDDPYPIDDSDEDEDDWGAEDVTRRKGTFDFPPTVEEASRAIKYLHNLLHPPRRPNAAGRKQGFKDPDLDKNTQKRLEHMRLFLWNFVDLQKAAAPGTPSKWTHASLLTAQQADSNSLPGEKKGVYLAHKLRSWTRAFLADYSELPNHRFGVAGRSLIDDEDFAQELNEVLMAKGKYCSALDLVRYIEQPEVLARLKRSKTISLATAQRWMKKLGYRWMRDPKGQYVDGHKREDVVYYRHNVFLPTLKDLEARTRKWMCENEAELHPDSSQRRVVLWFHDESTFYAHDRRKLRWIHRNEKIVPYAKGEGHSLMVADFVSADYGWLKSPDGKEEARIYFKAGKGRDGYFDNNDIRQQTQKAMEILEKYYPDEDHVLIFDNATTHCKRADDALSATKMPKGPSSSFGVDVNVLDADGRHVYRADGKYLKERKRMRNGKFADGTEQEFYFPDNLPTDHPDFQHRGSFKGIARILQERGLPSHMKLQCHSSFAKCPPGVKNCCCRRVLYDQPDFVAAESILETECRERGFKVLFLPKFHCELNFIEQCWGKAKREYRMYPPSSKEDDLETNVKRALDSVTLLNMRRFSVRSQRFMDAYRKGLNGI